MPNMWKVRAGQGANFIDDFIENNIVAIGWPRAGEIKVGVTREEITIKISSVWPNITKGKRGYRQDKYIVFLIK